jgi:hypothetical protein
VDGVHLFPGGELAEEFLGRSRPGLLLAKSVARTSHGGKFFSISEGEQERGLPKQELAEAEK